MAIRTPIPNDLRDSVKLERLIRTIVSVVNDLEVRVRALENATSMLARRKPNYNEISRELSATGSAPLSIDGLMGQAQQAQRTDIPNIENNSTADNESFLPDPRFSLQEMVIVSNASSGTATVYKLRRDSNPPRWESIDI